MFLFRLLCLFMLAILAIAAPCEEAISATTKEYYVKIYPADQYVYLKEYNVTANVKSPTEIQRAAKNIKEKVAASSYCNWKFGFNSWKSAEEAMFKEPDKKIVTGEFHLVTKEKNLLPMLEELFSGLFARKVTASISEKEIGIFFKGKGISLATPNNALGHYTKGEDNAIYWRNGARDYEAVFSIKEDGSNSLYPGFGSPARSPILTEAEVGKLKQGTTKR